MRRAVPVGALVALWWRGAALRRATVVLTVAFTLVGGVFVSISAFTPTADTAAQERFGRYQQATAIQLEVGALATAVPGAHLSLHNLPLSPDSNPHAIFYEKGYLPTQVIEDPDPRGGFPGRCHLDSGRWPEKAGEVTVSPAQEIADAPAPLLPPSPDRDASQAPGAGPLPGSETVLTQASTAAQIAGSASTRPGPGDAAPGPPSPRPASAPPSALTPIAWWPSGCHPPR